MEYSHTLSPLTSGPASHNPQYKKGDNTTNTFLEDIARVGEGEEWYGVPYEMWGEVPL